MAPKKDNLPLTLEQDNDSTGTITYANEVVAVIAGVAAAEVEGVAGMCSANGISEVFSRNSKNVTKGIKVEIGTEEASVDIYLIIEYGTPIQTACQNVQEGVRKAIEDMTGLHVVRVDVHVQGVSFEKENKETLVGLEELNTPVEAAKPVAKPAVKPEPVKEPVVEEPAEPTNEEPAVEEAPAEAEEEA
ncbi:MAG: Asp23/Gls24 family envelope stress response protein [Clostridia bacterium]|nr:Asp23/Gls24 family envelope stress response protein [Clostridia bacterium]